MANSSKKMTARELAWSNTNVRGMVDIEVGLAFDDGMDGALGPIHPEGNVFLGNAFSLQMVAPCAIITVEEASAGDIPAEAVSVIGHQDTAAVVSDILGREVACNRTSISLEEGDIIYVAQLMGGRLPEGATTLPEGFSIAFRKVTVTRSV